MRVSLNTFFVVELLCILLPENDTLGTIEMEFSFQTDESFGIEIFLSSFIFSLVHNEHKTLYNEINKMIFNGEASKRTIKFDIDDISTIFYHEGTLIISKNTENKSLYQFNTQSFQYVLSNNLNVKKNSVIYVSKSIYSRNLKKNLDVLLTGKCKPNYFPKFICTQFCKRNSHSVCDINGKIICHSGYYLSKNSQKCEKIVNPQSLTLVKIRRMKNQKSHEKNKGIKCNVEKFICELDICHNVTRCSPLEFQGENLSKRNSNFIHFRDTIWKTIALVIAVMICTYLVISGIILSIWIFYRPRKKKNQQDISSNSDESDSGQRYFLPDHRLCQIYSSGDYVNIEYINKHLKMKSCPATFPRCALEISNCELKKSNRVFFKDKISESF